jgi:hypothetical protein
MRDGINHIARIHSDGISRHIVIKGIIIMIDTIVLDIIEKNEDIISITKVNTE